MSHIKITTIHSTTKQQREDLAVLAQELSGAADETARRRGLALATLLLEHDNLMSKIRDLIVAAAGATFDHQEIVLTPRPAKGE
ncbi:MAG: hypothetical protein V4671_19530 [Armatimonadota bacterium]